VIHYHGTPMTPDIAAVQILTGRHAMVSFAHPAQISLVAGVCQSFTIDNGAFSLWKKGKQIDYDKFYRFVEDWATHPGFDWACVPDVIDGTEDQNDRLLEQWPFSTLVGMPVWHLHESLERLWVMGEKFGRVALGSSGEYATVGTPKWTARMAEIMETICMDGRPVFRLHGLRMLNPKVFTRYPFASADSTNIARNIGIDKHWRRGNYLPPTKAARGIVMALRIENQQSAELWVKEGTATTVGMACAAGTGTDTDSTT
jgi:hypothetical protein